VAFSHSLTEYKYRQHYTINKFVWQEYTQLNVFWLYRH